MFDPDISGVGHQPMGFDQMMLFYEQYTVLRSTISVTFITAGGAARVGVFLAPDTTSITNPITVVENGLCKWHCVDAASSSGGTGNRITTVELSFDTAVYFDRKRGKALLSDTNLFGTAAANPVEQAYFAVGVWAFYSQAVTTTVDCDVLVKYDAIYWEPRKLAPS